MPVIFGQEIDKKKLLIGGVVVAAAVAVVVWLRARAASADTSGTSAPAPQDQPQGMTVAAPTSDVAGGYQDQLNNAQLQAQTIANTYQGNLVAQQQKQFDFQMNQEQALAPALLQQQEAQLAVQTHFDTAASKAAVSCPGSASLRTGPDGQLYCRQKTSGGFLGIPVGDIFRTVQNFVGGVEAAAPSIGFQSAQAAAQYYTGQLFPAPGVPGKQVAKVQTPGIAPAPVLMSGGSHGYGEIA